MKIHIYTDGGSRGNPGPGASAFVAVRESEEGEKVLAKRAEPVGNCTNNEAEYRALIMGLTWARSRGIDDVHLHSDSQLMVRQIQGAYKVKAATIAPLYGKVMDLLKGMKWSIRHHSRNHRFISRCDELVNKVLDAA